MRKATTAALTAATLLVVGGYYGLADALDLVPGPLTVAAADYPIQPFPTPAPGTLVSAQAAGLSPDAPVPSDGVLTRYADALAADSLVGTGKVGVSVIDVATGEVLVDRGADTPLTPASSNKVLTAWSVLSVLGADHRVSTTATLSGSTVTLVGGGDVLLSADAGKPGDTVGHAGLGDLARATAEQLTAKGVTSVSVALDDTLFTGPTWNSAWEAGNEAFVAQIQPLMLDVTAHHNSGGYPADPAMEAAQTFVTRLGEAGITVTGTVARAASPADAVELAKVESAPLEDILKVSLKSSDNTMTEVEGRLLASAVHQEASFEGASAAVMSQLTKDGFDVTGAVLLDSSGLAVGNKVPPRLLAQIIARAAGDSGGTTGRTLLADLPVGGLDGTLNERFVGAAGEGTLRAKTGSLDQSASLTGTVVTQDGRLLAFAVIVDGFESGGLTAARTAIDKDLAGPLAACGCQG